MNRLKKHCWLRQTLLREVLLDEAEELVAGQQRLIYELSNLVQKYDVLCRGWQKEYGVLMAMLNRRNRELVISEVEKMHILKGFNRLHDQWAELRDEISQRKREDYAIRTAKFLDSLQQEELNAFREMYSAAPRFRKGAKRGRVNFRAFERELRRRFPRGIRGRKFLGDGNYAKKLINGP